MERLRSAFQPKDVIEAMKQSTVSELGIRVSAGGPACPPANDRKILRRVVGHGFKAPVPIDVGLVPGRYTTRSMCHSKLNAWL
jgi:hypothetical protein